jgi:hypothetical protein
MLIEANKVRFHCDLDQWGEVGGLPYAMEYFIAVREEWGKGASAHLKPSCTGSFMCGGGEFFCVQDYDVVFVVVHVWLAHGLKMFVINHLEMFVG